MIDWIEILGYAAAGAVFVTFWMKTIIPLRFVALIGNGLYLSYGLNADIGNIVVLHGALLPVNVLRLWQALRLRKKLRDMARAEFDAQSLLPFMSPLRKQAGSYLFRRGDPASDIYFLVSGGVTIEELGLAIAPGHLIGEIAMFAPDKTRTQSVRCETDCQLMRMTEQKAIQLYAENPEFGLYVTKMMVARLLENAAAPTAGRTRAAG